jgi:hypothetical protein
MSRFSNEVRIIPRVAWIIGLLAYVCMFWILMFGSKPGHHGLGDWPPLGHVAFAVGIPMIPLAAILLIGYINADARRRGMRYVMWTLLAIFLPNSIGIILYFVLRDPLTVCCGNCGAQTRPGFAYCPQCGAQLSNACPACKRPVEPGWKTCAYCGAGLNPGSSTPATRPAKS